MPLPLPPGLSRAKKSETPAGAGDETPAVQLARTRARQRLVGALVLLAVGVVAFPLVFDTQPRPLAADTPIRIAQRDSGAVQAAPAAAPGWSGLPSPSSPAAAASAPGLAQPALRASAPGPVLPPPDAGVEQAPAAGPAAAPGPAAAGSAVAGSAVTTAPAVARQAAASASRPAPAGVAGPAPASLPAAAPAPAAAASRPASPVASAAVPSRYVVQAGAYGDARGLREARSKVESLGLKTYTQVVDTEGGKRTRVRVGPFDTRAEAEAAAAKIKSGGLPANVLTL